jgi:hypothetical protein
MQRAHEFLNARPISTAMGAPLDMQTPEFYLDEDPAVVPLLLYLLRRDGNSSIRRHVLETLEKFTYGPRRIQIRNAVEIATWDSSPSVRLLAAEILERRYGVPRTK